MNRSQMAKFRQARLLVLLLGSLSVAMPADSQNRYMGASDYLQIAFSGDEPSASTLWVNSEIRESAEASLGYRITPLRVRYWKRDDRTAWILDEIGKERPITIGVVVENGTASLVRVLEFRESRGWEIRYPFFTDQFEDVGLDSQQRLDQNIDSITGATLSVDAVTRVVRLALFLHQQTTETHG
jgi:hypothetical protein